MSDDLDILAVSRSRFFDAVAHKLADIKRSKRPGAALHGDLIVGTSAIARHVGVDPKSVRNMLAAGLVPSRSVGGKVAVTRADADVLKLHRRRVGRPEGRARL